MEAQRGPASRARSAVFAPLGDAGRAVRIEQRLGEAIRSGLLSDGERLPSEAELAQMLGVATVTAREALVALRAQGLVTTVRGRGGGSFVARPADADDSALEARLAAMSRVDLYDRGALYGVYLTGCAELAAERADSCDIDDLGRLVPADDETDTGRWRQAEAELHLALAAIGQSARLAREIARVESDFGQLARLPLADPALRPEVRGRHLAIIGAVAERSVPGARDRMREHVTASLQSLARYHARLAEERR